MKKIVDFFLNRGGGHKKQTKKSEIQIQTFENPLKCLNNCSDSVTSEQLFIHENF